MMTSQEKTENAELIDEAKALKIAGWHLCSPETLKEKVEEAKGATVDETVQSIADETPVRRVAPKMKVFNRNEDTRERVAREYRQREPDCEFIYQASDVTDKDLEAKGLQRTGEQVGSDILCRTDKESFNEWRNANNEDALDVVRAIEKDNDGGKLVRRMTEAPRK